MTGVYKIVAVMALLVAGAAPERGWTPAVAVQHAGEVCVSYQARTDGEFLVVRVILEPGWHTFAMDNKVRAEEKLAGKQSLGIDRPTEISLTGGMRVAGPWYQSAPTDFSKPELRLFSWGFEKEALFAGRLRRLSARPTVIAIRGQACTQAVCKNIDVSIPLSAVNARPDAESSNVNMRDLVPVKTAVPRQPGTRRADRRAY